MTLDKRIVFFCNCEYLMMRKNRLSGSDIQVDAKGNLIQIQSDPFSTFFCPGHVCEKSCIADQPVSDSFDAAMSLSL